MPTIFQCRECGHKIKVYTPQHGPPDTCPVWECGYQGSVWWKEINHIPYEVDIKNIQEGKGSDWWRKLPICLCPNCDREVENKYEHYAGLDRWDCYL